MKPTWQTDDGSVRLLTGDCRVVLPTLEADSFTACVTDPPYELGFMGKRWDASGVAFDPATWAEVYRVLKPGAYLLAFGGTRTYHRMVCAIEDAGFEIRDCIMWIYGQGFPKSLNVGCRCANTKHESAEPKTEHDLPDLQQSDVSSAEPVGERQGSVLQPTVPEQSSPATGRKKLPAAAVRRGQPSVEGRGDVSTETGELPASAVRSLPAGISSDGPDGRLRDGASPGGGKSDGATPHANGVCASPQSQPAGQSGAEPCDVRLQPGSQTLRSPRHAAPDMGRCSHCGGIVGWQGYGTALKPAVEPIVVARKPLVGTVVANVQKHGTGALNIDGCRIATSDTYSYPNGPGGKSHHYSSDKRSAEVRPNPAENNPLGRWPANCIHDGSDEVLQVFPDAPGQLRPTGPQFDRKAQVYGTYAGVTAHEPRLDSGSAARFFQCCPQDTVCILCDTPYNRHGVTSVTNGESLCQPKSNTPVGSAAGSSSTSPATKGRSARKSVASNPVEQIAHNAKCAANLCDSCAIAFAHTLVETRRSASSSEVSRAIRDFTGSSKSYSLIRSLVSCAASLESIGTIPTIPSLSKLFGSVLPAIERFIKPESVEVAADDSDRDAATRFKYVAKASRSERGEGNKHPTVKPLALMEYLVKLVSVPEGNRILDPFAGSGTTLLACYNAFHEAVGIDLEADHVDISSGRVANEVEKTPLFKGASA